MLLRKVGPAVDLAEASGEQCFQNMTAVFCKKFYQYMKCEPKKVPTKNEDVCKILLNKIFKDRPADEIQHILDRRFKPKPDVAVDTVLTPDNLEHVEGVFEDREVEEIEKQIIEK